MPDAPDPLLQRQIAEKYQIQRKLGEGGMGSVYLARHQLLGHELVVKVMRPQFGADEHLRKRFMVEAQAMTAFVHPHAIPVRDFGIEYDGLIYMTMDLAPGESLARMIERRRKLPDSAKRRGVIACEHAFPIACQILDVLSVAHAHAIVHRDLKPDNIMVDMPNDVPNIKILDFGIAKILSEVRGEKEDGGDLTQTGSVIGTPHYMSPEQASGEAIDTRTDLYATGVILYEMLCGGLPIVAPTAVKMLFAIAGEPPRPMQEYAPYLEAPPRLVAMIDKALAKSPDERFTSAEAFLAELTAVMGEMKIEVRRISSGSLQVSTAAPRAEAAAESVDDQKRRAARPAASVETDASPPPARTRPRAGAAATIRLPSTPVEAAESREAERAARNRNRRNKLMVRLGIVAALAGAGMAAAVAFRPDPYEQAMQAGRQLLAAGNPEAAGERFGQARTIRQTPEVAAALREVELAQVRRSADDLIGGRRLGEALKVLDEAAAWLGGGSELDGLYHKLHAERMRKSFNEGAYEEALAAAALAERYGAFASEMARVHKSLGFQLALAEAEKALKHRSFAKAREAYQRARKLAMGGQVGRAAMLADEIDRAEKGAQKELNALLGADEKPITRVTLAGHPFRITTLAIGPHGRYAASSGGDMRLWDARNKSRGTILAKRSAGGPHAIVFLPDGKSLLVGDGDGYITRYAVPAGTVQRRIRAHRGKVLALSTGRKGQRIASLGDDSPNVQLWRGPDLKHERALAGLSGAPTDVRCSPDESTVVAASGSGAIRLWTSPDWTRGRTTAAHSRRIDALAFDPRGKLLASASSLERRIRLWKFPGMADLGAIRTRAGARSIAFSPDGKFLLAGPTLWRTADRKLARLLRIRPPVAISAGARVVAAVARKNDRAMLIIPLDEKP